MLASNPLKTVDAEPNGWLGVCRSYGQTNLYSMPGTVHNNMQ